MAGIEVATGKLMEGHEAQTPKASSAVTGSAAYLRDLKEEIIEMIRSTELDDDDELGLHSQELIVGWVDVFFENKIFDDHLE